MNSYYNFFAMLCCLDFKHILRPQLMTHHRVLRRHGRVANEEVKDSRGQPMTLRKPCVSTRLQILWRIEYNTRSFAVFQLTASISGKGSH